MGDYPQGLVTVDHVEPVPRRVRATLGGRTVVDTVDAVYVWEIPYYPQFYVPLADIDQGALVDEKKEQRLKRGTARRFGLAAGDQTRPGSVHVYGEDAMAGLRDMVKIDWAAPDAWYEEDEQIFVHPRSPYVRVDALRSTRQVTVKLDGTKLADSNSTVMVFETGLPTRYYFNRTEVDFRNLVDSDTVTACPYKGQTSGYWSVRTGDQVHKDLAWAYDFPTRQLLPITGLIAFYNEKVDIEIDGKPILRPKTHFS